MGSTMRLWFGTRCGTCPTRSSPQCSWAVPRSCATATSTASPWSTSWRKRSRASILRSRSISRTSRCLGRVSASASRAGSSPTGSRTKGLTSRSAHPSSGRSICRRRAGGGLAGAVWTSNVAAGMHKALEREPELVIFDGSGAAIPPVDVDRRILVAGAHQDPELVSGYLNAYRILVSDLVVLTMAEDGADYDAVAGAVRHVKDVP